MERLFKGGMEPLRKSGSIVEIFIENNKKPNHRNKQTRLNKEWTENWTQTNEQTNVAMKWRECSAGE